MEEKNNSFRERVRSIVRKIPQGQTLSYKEVARRAGNPLAARAVARIMACNYDPNIPCHRVIRTDGALGGYNRGGIKAKRQLLERESREAHPKKLIASR
jgi:O-6-methylguanine DNA methyltransferase